jgi:hypothetical protein
MERPFPKRILALDRNSGGDISVKVLEVENKVIFGIYATLSHYWGPEMPCVLSTEDRTNRLCGIPWTELPQTFQDAIRYCLALGVFYLWIDALCIIQDDPGDWQIQSAMMGSIYENSYITLAATASDCGSSGCFQKESIVYKERSLEVSRTGGQVYQVLIRQLTPHWAVPSTSESKRDNALLSRGWVFQERILSPRVLHFCKHELVWECGQETLCECGSIPKTRSLKLQFALAARLQGAEEVPKLEQRDERSNSPQISSSQRMDFHSVEESGILSDAINQWHAIVEQYSILKLTRDRDSLPALSGLAERMAPFLGEYLAGLWKRSFLSDLCWRVDKLAFGPQRPAEYRGPSWSWISTKAEVAFWTQEEITPRVTVAEPYATHSRDTRFGSSAHDSRAQAFLNHRAPALDIISCTVDIGRRNKYGEVSSTLLLVDGNLKASKLWEVPAISFRNSALPPSFEVEVEFLSQTSPGLEMDPTRVDSWRLPFFADYILSNERGHRVDGSELVFLLSISPTICLVPSKTSLRLSRDTCIFLRIGILKVPQYRYAVAVMRGLQRTRVAII